MEFYREKIKDLWDETVTGSIMGGRGGRTEHQTTTEKDRNQKVGRQPPHGKIGKKK